MRRFLALILALCLVPGLSGCQVITTGIIRTQEASSGEDALYDHSLELAELLEEMLSSPEYFEMMGGSAQLSEVINPLMRSDLSEPESAYRAVLPEDAFLSLMNAAESDIDDFPGPLQEFIKRKIHHSMLSILNSQAGAETLAAASILTVSDAWAGDTLEQNCYVVLIYPDVCPVIVSFYGRDGFLEGTASMLLGVSLDEDSPEAVSGLFQYFDTDDMLIEELDIDKN